jgi:hypothetical protein
MLTVAGWKVRLRTYGARMPCRAKRTGSADFRKSPGRQLLLVYELDFR